MRNKWIQLYTQFLRQNKVTPRQFKLEAGISDGSIDENQVKEFEKNLQLRTEGFNYAEKGAERFTAVKSPSVQQFRKPDLKLNCGRRQVPSLVEENIAPPNFVD